MVQLASSTIKLNSFHIKMVNFATNSMQLVCEVVSSQLVSKDASSSSRLVSEDASSENREEDGKHMYSEYCLQFVMPEHR